MVVYYSIVTFVWDHGLHIYTGVSMVEIHHSSIVGYKKATIHIASD